MAGSTSRALLAALAVGVAVRLLTLRLPRLWYDEATSGLLGLAVLQGDLPTYFFGQPFMGALDGYLAAPLFWLLGVSARTVELVPVLLSLVTLGLTVRLACDAFGPRAAVFAAAGLAVPPDFLLFWAHEARNHYPLTLVLGTLALLFALRAPAARGGRAGLLFLLLGAGLGLAFWTNFLSLVYFPAVAVLLLRRGLRPLLPAGLVAVPAFLIASLPHWLYGLPHGSAMPPPGRAVGVETMLGHLGHFGRTAWPIVAGVPASVRGAALGVGLALALGALYLAAAATALGAARRAAPPAGAAALALVTLVGVNVGVAVVTRYGRGLDDNDPHYLLPLYTALPPLLGWLLARLGDHRARILAGAVVAFQAVGALGGSLANLHPAIAAAERSELRAQLATLDGLDRAGLHRLYDSDATGRVLTVLSAGRTIVSDPYEEIRPSFARAVDGAPAAAWWMPRRAPRLEAHFAALGVRFEFRRVNRLGGAYAAFALVAPPVRELPAAGLRVTASDATDGAGRMTDRIAETLWSTGRPQRGGEWVQVDLGAVVPVALVRWLPGTFQEVPRGLRLEASLDGAAWRTLVDLPEYVGPLYWSAGQPVQRVRAGRVELRVAPTPARHLRIVQTGRGGTWAWTIRELYVYAAAGPDAVPAVQADGPALARGVRQAGVRHLFADLGWASRVALADPGIRVPPANLQLDDYGWKGAASMLLPPFVWEPGTGVLLEPADAEGFVEAARAGGLGFTRRALDGLTLFVHASVAPPVPRLPVGALAVTASRHPKGAGLAVDGNPATRWATAGPRAAGDWFRVELSAPRAVRAVRLEVANPADLPPAIVVEGSPDGTRWERLATTARPEHRYRWGGFTILDDGMVALALEFPPTTVRALRLVLPAGDPVFDWSINELAVFGGE